MPLFTQLKRIAKLLLPSLVVLLSLWAAVCTLKHISLSQVYAPLHTPFHNLLRSQKGLWIFEPDYTGALSPMALDAATSTKAVPKLELSMSRNHTWWLYPYKYLHPHTSAKGFIEHKTDQELKGTRWQKSQKPLLTLDAALKRTPHAPAVLLVLRGSFAPQEVNRGIGNLISNLTTYAKKPVLIQTHNQHLLKQLKSQKPQWLYGLPVSSKTKLFLFLSLGLQSLVSLRADFVLWNEQESARHGFTKALLETKRRQMLNLLDFSIVPKHSPPSSAWVYDLAIRPTANLPQ